MLWSAAKQLSNGRGQVTIVGSGLEERLQNRVYGCFKDAALREAFKVVRDNVGLDIQGEYGSLEISDKDFVSSKS
jgi:hypothetical protein